MLVKLMSVIAYGSTQAMAPPTRRGGVRQAARRRSPCPGPAARSCSTTSTGRSRSPTLAACAASDPCAGRVLERAPAPAVPNAPRCTARRATTSRSAAISAGGCYRIRLKLSAGRTPTTAGEGSRMTSSSSGQRGSVTAAPPLLAALVRAWWVAGQPSAEGRAYGRVDRMGPRRRSAGVRSRRRGFLANLDGCARAATSATARWTASSPSGASSSGRHRSPPPISRASSAQSRRFGRRCTGRVGRAWDTASWPTTAGSNLAAPRQGRYHGEAGFYIEAPPHRPEARPGDLVGRPVRRPRPRPRRRDRPTP